MRVATLALAALLAGCGSGFMLNDFQRDGRMRVSAHPTVPGAQQVTWTIHPNRTSSYYANINTADGRQDIAKLLMPRCPNPRVIEENRAPFSPDILGGERMIITTRIECA
jgi:hypothetical protein